jgi:purine-binding chemotaxis protein CheW
MTDAVDWVAARERLERLRAALTAEVTPEEERRVLEERARALARPPAAEDDEDEQLDIVLFVLGGERFAVEAARVLAAAPLTAPTPVPGTPGVLLGVINQRGRVVPVLDLHRQLAPDAERGELTHVVTVAVDGMTFGIAAEAVLETTRERCAVGGVTGELVTVLDLEALAADPRLRIDDD